jgi:hypothetical protein
LFRLDLEGVNELAGMFERIHSPPREEGWLRH